MITNLLVEAEVVAQSVLGNSHVSDEHVSFAVSMITESHIEQHPMGVPRIKHIECIGVWIITDMEGEMRLHTKIAVPVQEYTEEVLRNKLQEAWDAFVLARMEHRLQ